jgi:hypothetical protein
MPTQLRMTQDRIKLVETGRVISAWVDGNYAGEARGTEERVHGRIRVVWGVETKQHGHRGRGYNKAAARRRLKELLAG